MRVLSKEEAIAKVDEYGLKESLELCLRVGASATAYNGRYQLVICENMAKYGYYPVIPCAVYDRNGEMIYRFNIQVH